MQDLAGQNGGQYLAGILWTVGALVLLVVILMLVRFAKRGGGSFVGGSRDRPRLALGDSIAIDNQRRLVLVRRDNVEHLILTGGPSDVVVEQGIGAQPLPAQRVREAVAERPAVSRPAEPALVAPVPAPAVRPASATAPEEERAAIRPHAEPAPDTPLAAGPREASPGPVRSAAEPPVASRSEPHVATAAPAPHAVDAAPPLRPAPVAEPASHPYGTVTPIRAAPHARGPEEDDIVEFPHEDAARARRATAERRDGSLEDEMSRLLEDISDDRR